MSLLAKSIVKNKCWVVEEDGHKIGTIMTNPKGVVYVDQLHLRKEQFPNLKLLSERYNIVIDKTKNIKIHQTENNVYGYPTEHRSHNQLWDVRKGVPVYTKSPKSKSFYCAGHYIIKFNNGWVKSFCPKLITLNRYEYQGPFATREEMQERLRQANEH